MRGMHGLRAGIGEQSGPPIWTPARIAGVYAVVAASWIGISDVLVVRWAPNVMEAGLLSLLKGLMFVLVTGGLLLVLLKLEARARLKAQAAQQRTQEQFRRLFEDAPFAAMVHAEGGEIVAVNRTWTELSGYPQEQIPTIAAWVERAHGQEKDAVLARISELYALEQRRDHGESAITTAKGERRIWQFSSSPLGRDEAGRRLVLSMAVDVTARSEAEQRLQQAKQAADQANSTKDRFIAMLSHGLRTPLTPVLAALSDMEGDPRFAASVREDLAVMRQNIQTESRLIDDLLDLNRIVHGKLHLERAPLSLGAVLNQAIRVCSLQISAKDLYVQTDIREDIQVMGDPDRLQQVFCNLLDNAAKFTPQHGRIAVRCCTEGGSVVAEISDTGVGIPAHVLPRLFNAFQQADEHVTRVWGGLGLGLAICRSLVESHGGQISIASPGQGQGTTVRIVLPEHLPLPASAPIQQGAATQVPPAPAHSPAHSPARRKSAARILLVEDHPDTAKLLMRILSKGYQVEHASTMGQAVQKLSDARFDLLVSDIGLPDGTGLDVMRAGRARDPELRGIAISGYGMDDDLERSQQAGFATHLIKPVNAKTLNSIISRLLTK